MSELKPCPFCGNDLIVVTPADGTYDTATCVACGVKVTSHEAIKQWNTRATDPRIARYEKALEDINYGVRVCNIDNPTQDEIIMAYRAVARRALEGTE